MDFRYPAEAETFRTEFRSWLEENLDDRYRGLNMLDPTGDDMATYREWLKRLVDARYAAISWPEEYGGRAAGVMEQVVYAEEMSRASAPGHINSLGLSNIAPAIMHWGSEEQKRSILPRMLTGEDVWCQGFSEPGAGSDLASLQCRAILDGDHYIVNGQKVWTTVGHIANWCELLVRTDPEAPKHKGISCLLVDMRSPGVEVRPLVTITGEREFNEMFFTDVRVPAANLLGPENAGWQVAMTTLTYERGGVVSLHLMVRRKIQQLLELAKSTKLNAGTAAEHPVVRQALARVYLKGEYLKLLADRAISRELHGKPMGPEASLGKLVWSELEQEIGETAALVLGPAANAGEWGRSRVYSRALTIAGGTTQINKGIVAQRVLGLPKAR